jgi:hypothetical protein
MTASSQMTQLLPMTVPFSERLSEAWLLERTYHARLRTGRELSVPDLTLAMKQLNDFDVPLSTWREVLQEEAQAASHQAIPVLLYSEHTWEHPQGAREVWRANTHMHAIIFGNAEVQPEAVSGTDYAVCSIDAQRGTFSNPAWRTWFASDSAALLTDGNYSTIAFFVPWVQFPFTTHYTVIAADGQIHEYVTSAQAIQGFRSFPPQEVRSGNQLQTVFPQFCYYHEVTCPGGVYRLEFFGPRRGERGYQVKEAV